MLRQQNFWQSELVNSASNANDQSQPGHRRYSVVMTSVLLPAPINFAFISLGLPDGMAVYQVGSEYLGCMFVPAALGLIWRLGACG